MKIEQIIGMLEKLDQKVMVVHSELVMAAGGCMDAQALEAALEGLGVEVWKKVLS